MKKLFFITVLLNTLQIYTQINSHINSQVNSNPWECSAKIESNSGFGPVGRADLEVIVVYIDFPDGRMQPGNVVPSDGGELYRVENLDAVLNMGYVEDPHDGPDVYNAVTRKYTYADCWNRYFADGIYIRSLHPDWKSHGRFGFPPTGDTARAWGSLRDYFWEVSYHNLNILPAVTHPSSNGIYRTGILNRVDFVRNVGFVRPIMMPNPKSSYGTPVDWHTIQADAMEKILAAFPEETDIDMNNFTGKIIFVAAGGNDGDGGVGGGNSCIVREKFVINTFPDKRYSVINGIAVSCHEFGHMLGWGHTPLAYYCLMGPGKTYQNCPSHPCMIFKLQMGWVNPANVRTVRTTQDVTGLPPSEYAGDCALITLYGKPGFNNEYTGHSEYYVIENRRMLDDASIKFDKRFVWREDLKPPGFTGGCLITHYTAHNTFTTNGGTGFRIISADPLRNPVLWSDEGHSRDFFGVPVINLPQGFSELESSRTNSSFELTTGLRLTGISQDAGGEISFHAEYTLGPQPDYNHVLYGQDNLPEPMNLSGAVFLTSGLGNAKHLSIAPGTVVDILTNNFSSIRFEEGGIEADGTASQPITFRGCGYNQFRVQHGGLMFNERNPMGSVDQTIFKFCNFQNITGSFAVSLSSIEFLPSIPEIIIENNTFEAGKKILISAPSHTRGSYQVINSIKNNNCSFDFFSNVARGIIIDGAIEIPAGSSLKFNVSGAISRYKLTSGSYIQISGSMYAEGTAATRFEFNKDSLSSTNWSGIRVNGGTVKMKFCNVMNSTNGVTVSSMTGDSVLIERCRFENNTNSDVEVNGFNGSMLLVISNSEFTGPRVKYNLGLLNGTNANVFNNVFSGTDAAVQVESVVNPTMQENFINGSASTNSKGIFSVSSGGSYTCNEIQNCSSGMMFNNSSPGLFNTKLHDNVKGLFLTNGSNPVMTGSSENGTSRVLPAGFNSIVNNTDEAIFCENSPSLPLSLPQMQNGSNIIFGSPCYINVTLSPQVLNAEGNYWGFDPEPENFCPAAMVNFANWLTTEPLLSCSTDKPSSEKEQQKNTGIPNAFKLHQNYPNPFNPVSVIKYDIPASAFVKITIYDLLGREIKILVERIMQAGYHETVFDGSPYASGVYFYRIEAGTFVEIKKMVLVK